MKTKSVAYMAVNLKSPVGIADSCIRDRRYLLYCVCQLELFQRRAVRQLDIADPAYIANAAQSLGPLTAIIVGE